MAQLLRHRRNEAGVNGHLASLSADHGLVIERGDVIRFSRTHLGLPSDTTAEAGNASDGPWGGDLFRFSSEAAGHGYFSSDGDQRERVLREVVQRRGQPAFRADLIRAYGGRCAVTGCDAAAALEAAHIAPYSGPASNHVGNGLLLRADIHTLFDLDLIGIDPATLTVCLAPALQGTAYDDLSERKLRPPADPPGLPSRPALEARWQKFLRR
jgi:hypothetical protein